ncbi:MAG TPA: hypothetical protein VGC16_09305, partial [Rhizomicrobium sp.]
MERTDLSQHRVLLAGPKTHGMLLLRSVMGIAGVGKVLHIEDGRRALELLGMEHFNAVFYEHGAASIDGKPFIVAARRSDAILNPMIAIFALAERARRRDVEAARDTGVTDVLTTPISPRTILTKLRTAAETPRPFIVAKE